MTRRLSVTALSLILALLSAGLRPVTGYADATPTATEGDQAEVGSLRARPSPRPYDNPHAQPGAGAGTGAGAGASDDVRGSRALETTEEAGPPRLDDPVLRWLPEITAASAQTGTPISLIAGIMRVESSGDPSITSPQGAQGLMQIMPAEMRAQGIPGDRWLDPATNVMAGAVILAQRSGGGWEGAAAYYFGIGCDYYGTCTFGYAVAVIGWANAYATLLGDPIWYDVGRIPAVPDAPEPTATPTDVPTATAPPTTAPPTTAPPTETPMPPTATNTPVPTATEVPPTATPTDVPPTTAPPTTAPPEPPTETPMA